MIFQQLLFAGSVFGYYCFYRNCIRKNIAYFPIVSISFMTILVYIFGVFEKLNWGVYFAVSLGYIFVVYSIYCACKKKRRFWGTEHSWVIAFWIIAIMWLFFITRDCGISHTDDFSHWYKICKMMNAEHAYPTQPDMLFPSYVPGTATWIYIFTRFSGFSAGNCFFAQALINIACCSVLFVGIPEKADRVSKTIGVAFVGMVSILLCAMDVSTYVLLVDTVIALVPFTAFVMIWKQNTRPDAILFGLVMLVACFASIIKTSGLLFAAFLAIAWITKFKIVNHIKISCVQIYQALVIVAIPYILTRLYIARAATIYGDLSQTKQGVSIERYVSIFSERTPQQLLDICGKFFSEIFLLSGGITQIKIIWICLLLLVLFCAYTYCVNNKKVNQVMYVTVYLAVLFFAYSLGLLGTYLFSMNDTEANVSHLACLYRYTGTATIFIAGVSALFLIQQIFEGEKEKQIYRLVASFVAITLIGTSYLHTGYIWGLNQYKWQEDDAYTSYIWDLCQEYVPENDEYNDNSYAVIWKETTDYSWKISKVLVTHLRSNKVEAFKLSNLEENKISDNQKEYLRNCDYLVTLGDYSDDLETIEQYVTLNEYTPGISEIVK